MSVLLALSLSAAAQPVEARVLPVAAEQPDGSLAFLDEIVVEHRGLQCSEDLLSWSEAALMARRPDDMAIEQVVWSWARDTEACLDTHPCPEVEPGAACLVQTDASGQVYDLFVVDGIGDMWVCTLPVQADACLPQPDAADLRACEPASMPVPCGLQPQE